MTAADPPPRPPSPLELLGDRRAIVDTGLGPVAFVTINALSDLDTAAIAAVAISVVVAAYRAIRRHPLTNAIGGVLGTGLAVFIALRTGSASGYFVPRALQNAGLVGVRVRGEELLANWFGWFNRTLESSADPAGIPWAWIQYAYHGYLLLQRVDRRLLEPRLPPEIFYNLMLAATKPR